jgi:regulatory protein
VAGKVPPEVSLRARALRMLARREHSRLELTRKLARYTEDVAEIEFLLDEFERSGWLSEKRVVDFTLTVRRKRFGVSRIIHELREKGVSEDAIAGVLPQLKGTELDAVRNVWQRKFGRPPSTAQDKARQIRFLQNRGFALEIILKLLKSDATTDEHG